MSMSAIAARVAAALLTSEKGRKGVGFLLVAIFAPVILIAAILCSATSGGADHNNLAVEASFYGISFTDSVPAEFQTHITDMQSAFSFLDSAVAEANATMTDGNRLDPIQVKAIFYALCFGESAPSQRAADRFVDCFFITEQRTRIVVTELEDGSTVETEEVYTATVPLSLAAAYENLAAKLGRTVTDEDKENAAHIYTMIAGNANGSDGTGASGGTIQIDYGYGSGSTELDTSGFTNPAGKNADDLVQYAIHAYHNEVSQPTALQKQMVQELSERAAKVHAGSVDASTDNMLKITSDGRKLGLDQRVINPDLPDDPNSKVNRCVDNIHRIWQDGQTEKLTQLVFCDLSTPKGKAAQSGRIAAKGTDSPELHALEAAIDAETEPEEPPFTIYDDIREKLVARGIAREQIAFIHEANTEARKKELFAKVRSGQVRVLMGSTFKMGAGMNVQDRLVALHDLDCPWRPGDLEQRSGRIIRQGNRNKEVHIYRYVTESTFDAYLWQTVENKQKFISQIMTSKSPVRSCEDIDEAALSYAEIKALCAGDERIREKMDLDVDVARLRLMKANHQSQQYRLEDNILRHFPAQIEENKGFLSGFEADMKTLEVHPHPKDGFAGMEVKGDFLTDKDNAGAAILEAFKDAKGLESVPIGTYRGFSMSLTVENFGKDFILTLKGRMSHRVELGKDARGNLVRIDNALAQMPERYKTVQGRLENVQAQLATAKAELGKPFPQEAELKEKSARLAELNAELNIDDRTPMEQAAENVVAKRPSVLGKLKAPSVHGAGEKKKSHEQEAR